MNVGQMKKCRKCYETGSEVIHLPRPKNRSNVPRPSKREYLDIANRNMSKIDKQKTHQNMGETSSPLPSLPARKPPKERNAVKMTHGIDHAEFQEKRSEENPGNHLVKPASHLPRGQCPQSATCSNPVLPLGAIRCRG